MTEPSLDPRALLTFREVVLHGSFSSAARALGWSQPALSQQVRKLEEQLGSSLVVRSSRGITLTEAGRLLLTHADALHARLARASLDISTLSSSASRRVSVAAFPSACTSIVAPIMSYFMAAEQSSRIDLSLTQREPSEVTAPLLSGEIDLALVFRYEFEDLPWDQEEITAEVLGSEPLMLLVPSAGASAESVANVPGRIEDYADARWVSGCEFCRHHLLYAAGRAGFEPLIQHSTDDSRVVQELVSRGQCVALVPYLSLRGLAHTGTIARPLEAPLRREILLLSRTDVASEQVDRVATQLRNGVAKALAEGS